MFGAPKSSLWNYSSRCPRITKFSDKNTMFNRLFRIKVFLQDLTIKKLHFSLRTSNSIISNCQKKIYRFKNPENGVICLIVNGSQQSLITFYFVHTAKMFDFLVSTLFALLQKQYFASFVKTAYFLYMAGI